MTNHPIHLHGHEFEVTGTDGGPTPQALALARGDGRHRGRPDAAARVRRRRGGRLGLPLPQEPPHDERDGPRRADHDRRRPPATWSSKIRKLVPDYMVDGRARHGRHGRDGDAAARQHRADDERRRARSAGSRWAACSRVLKVRRDQQPGDYRDPGWFRHPAGTVAYEFTGQMPEPARPAAGAAPARSAPVGDVEVQIRKPGGHGGHH